MKQWSQTLQATLELVSEMVDREWRTQEEWRSYSAVQKPLFAQVAQWLEAFAGQPLFEPWGTHREQQRLLARQVRDELFLLFSEMEPAQVIAVLCSLPAAQVLGYQQDRLATLLTVEAEHVEAWEQEGFVRLLELVSPRTPLLQFVAQRVTEVGGSVGEQSGSFASNVGSTFRSEWTVAPFPERPLGVSDRGTAVAGGKNGLAFVSASTATSVATEKNADREFGTQGASLSAPAVRTIHDEDLSLMLQEARMRPHFDLRQFVTPALELSIRQALHQLGLEAVAEIQSLFAKEDRATVLLVAERMKVEMFGGREERADG